MQNSVVERKLHKSQLIKFVLKKTLISHPCELSAQFLLKNFVIYRKMYFLKRFINSPKIEVMNTLLQFSLIIKRLICSYLC